jgi:hypothetical protein
VCKRDSIDGSQQAHGPDTPSEKAGGDAAMRPDLNSLVPPCSPSEVSCQRGTNRYNGRGIENTRQYAWLLAQHGRCDEALRLCNAALRRYPNHTGLLITREDVLMLSGDVSPQVRCLSPKRTEVLKCEEGVMDERHPGRGHGRSCPCTGRHTPLLPACVTPGDDFSVCSLPSGTPQREIVAPGGVPPSAIVYVSQLRHPLQLGTSYFHR